MNNGAEASRQEAAAGTDSGGAVCARRYVQYYTWKVIKLFRACARAARKSSLGRAALA